MEIERVRAILFKNGPEAGDILQFHGFKPWEENQKFATGVNIIVVNPEEQTVHVVFFAEEAEKNEVFDFTNYPIIPEFTRGEDPFKVFTPQSLYKVVED